MLAHLLEWHRREDKPVWWRYFDIVTAYVPGDLVDDRGCLDLLEYVGVDGAEKNSMLHRYRSTPQQEHKIKVGDRPPDPAVERDELLFGVRRVSPGEVVEIDPIAGELVLEAGPQLRRAASRSR